MLEQLFDTKIVTSLVLRDSVDPSKYNCWEVIGTVASKLNQQFQFIVIYVYDIIIHALVIFGLLSLPH